jgi:hypothetical protein
MSVTLKQREEIDLASRLLDALGYRQLVLEPSDRPDVLTQIGNLRVGIEVTQFHGDEEPNKKGSVLRATEERSARQAPNQSYAMNFPINPNPALVARVTDKIALAAAYDKARYDQLWLLIASGIPQLGAVAATFAVSEFVDIKQLNASTHALLSDSPFSAAYIQVHLRRALFRWSPHEKWHSIQGVPE